MVFFIWNENSFEFAKDVVVSDEDDYGENNNFFELLLLESS